LGTDASHVMDMIQYIDTLKEIGGNSKSNVVFVPHTPGKASNAGGVAVSALEMTQNSQCIILHQHVLEPNILNESVVNSSTYTREDLGTNVKSSTNKTDATVSPLSSLVQGYYWFH